MITEMLSFLRRGKALHEILFYSDRSGAEPIREIEQAKRELADFIERDINNG